jgi:hypothetical protein
MRGGDELFEFGQNFCTGEHLVSEARNKSFGIIGAVLAVDGRAGAS